MDDSIFEQFKATLKGGGIQTVSSPQLFPTPSNIAARMVELADIQTGERVLEPSAGTGRIIAELPFDCQVVAVEINHSLSQLLKGMRGFNQLAVFNNDFLNLRPEIFEPFDAIIMNPPFQNGDDIRHIKHALNFLKPGGRLIALCADGPRQARALQPLADMWEPLPPGTFKEAGTMVNVVLMKITP